ncbi:MAG: hypothetical protein F4Y89_14360 [Gammaproteobacteria bacterium]|nr:hypothetical protein [Gammaproteobacteria bacterium]MYG97539.1 hypothetical protein [Gammaproteobacteria bacterium]
MLSKLIEFETSFKLVNSQVKDFHKKFPDNYILGAISSNIEELAVTHINKAVQQEVYLAKYGHLLKNSDTPLPDKFNTRRPEEIVNNIEIMLGYSQYSLIRLKELPIAVISRLEGRIFQLFVYDEENGSIDHKNARTEEKGSTNSLDNELVFQFQEIKCILIKIHNHAEKIGKLFRKNKVLGFIQDYLNDVVDFTFDLAIDAELFNPAKGLKGESLANKLVETGVPDKSPSNNNLDLVERIEILMDLDRGDLIGLEDAPVRTLQKIYLVIRQSVMEPLEMPITNEISGKESIPSPGKWDGWHVSGHGPLRVRLVRRTNLGIEEFYIPTKTYWNEIGGRLPFVRIVKLDQKIFDKILKYRRTDNKAGWHILDQGPLTVVLIGWAGKYFEAVRISSVDFWNHKLDKLPKVGRIYEHLNQAEERRETIRKQNEKSEELVKTRKEKIREICIKLRETPPDMEKMSLQELGDLQVSLHHSLEIQETLEKLQAELKKLCEEIGRAVPNTDSYTKKELESAVNLAKKLLVVYRINDEVNILIDKLISAYEKSNKSFPKDLIKARAKRQKWAESINRIQLGNRRNKIDSIRWELITTKSSLEELLSRILHE